MEAQLLSVALRHLSTWRSIASTNNQYARVTTSLIQPNFSRRRRGHDGLDPRRRAVGAKHLQEPVLDERPRRRCRLMSRRPLQPAEDSPVDQQRPVRQAPDDVPS